MFKIFGWLRSKLFPKRLSNIEYIASVIEEGIPPEQPRKLIDFYEVAADYINGLSKAHKEDVANLIDNTCAFKPRDVQLEWNLCLDPSITDEIIIEFLNGDEVIILSKSDRMKNASMLRP